MATSDVVDHPGRDVGLDAARGVAILSMFVAHFAPTPGPAQVLQLSEHLTAFLFVLLIGCGAELGRHSAHRWRSSQVRAAALVVLGLLLMQLPTQIVVVLVWLGVMTLVATWLVALRSVALGALALASVAVGPLLVEASREWRVEGARDLLSLAAGDLLVSGDSYRVVSFLAPVCAGILLVRHVRSTRMRAVLLVVAGVVCGCVLALDRSGVVTLTAYSGTGAQVGFDTALAIVATCACWLLAERVRGVAVVAAGIGTLSLTVYSLQIVGDWAYFRAGGVTDDRWVVLLGAFAATIALAVAWRPVERVTGWRGPLEAVVDRLARGGRGA